MWSLNKISTIFLAALALPSLRLASGAPESALETHISSAFQFSMADHLLIASRQDPSGTGNLASNLLMHEDNLRASYEPYNVDVLFADRFRLGGLQQPDQPFLLEKTTATADWEKWELKAGDSHQELGKGIALSLYQDDVFGVNNTLLGASLHFRPAGFDGQLFGGEVNSLKSPVGINVLPDPLIARKVLIAGGSIGANLSADSKFSTHYFAALQQLRGSTRYNKSWHTVGGTFTYDNLLPGIDAYLEANALFSQLASGGQLIYLPNGYGNFASLAWSPGAWTVKLDVKDYRTYEFDFRRPPTLEDDVVVTLNTDNVSGSRLSVIRKLESGSSIGGSFLGGYDWNLQAPVYHGIASTKWYIIGRSTVEVKGGYRSEPGKENLFHSQIKTRIPTGHGEALELGYRKYFEHDKLDELPITDDRNMFDLTYTFSEYFNAGLGFEYVPTLAPELNPNFVNVQASYKTGPLVAKGFVGQTSGGTLCSGGVCRQVPPFTGAYVESSYAF